MRRPLCLAMLGFVAAVRIITWIKPLPVPSPPTEDGQRLSLIHIFPVGDIINRALEKGLILINAGTNIIRFVPPLVITKENVDEMLAILTECLDEKKTS